MKKLVESGLENLSTKNVFPFQIQCRSCSRVYANRLRHFTIADSVPQTKEKQIRYDALYERELYDAKRSGSVLLCFLLNLLLNLEWSIPAWILLGLHFWLGMSLWWFIGGLALWCLRVLLGMWLLGWAADCGNQKDPQKENKNPYSNKKYNV